MKKLYYTIEIGIEDTEYITGNKTVYVYDIVENIPNQILSFECGNEENTKSEILDHLDSDVYPNDIELIQL